MPSSSPFFLFPSINFSPTAFLNLFCKKTLT
jgi:hypothetical protein